ncbi:MAG: serine/threonine-protein phosphatase [Chloroflexi bacterium]|nr:serine/threonine-protein phosphatase [Chloroflexota bacterium]
MNFHPESVRFEFGAATDSGRKRGTEPNQDTVEVVLPKTTRDWHPPLLLVADGLGKYSGGAFASELVIQTFKQEFQLAQHPSDYPTLMENCLQAAHQAIRLNSAKNPELAYMGSTLVAITLEAKQLHLLNVGDSRAYLVRDKNILQISEDQSWVASQVRAGVLTQDEARLHPGRNRLTMAITAKRTEVVPYISTLSLGPGDIVLLCSDGLWGVVPETLIRAAAMELPPPVAVEKLIALANGVGSPDNISVVIARQLDFPRRAMNVDPQDTAA